jgi:GxxExxY protein
MLADAPFNAITHEIISAAIEVHRTLGPGLLESSYTSCLQYELALHKVRFVAERSVAIVYKGITLDTRYRLDLIVEDTVVVEVKAIEQVQSVHKAEVVTYLQLTGCAVGLLINFNVAKLIDGVTRLLHPRR